MHIQYPFNAEYIDTPRSGTYVTKTIPCKSRTATSQSESMVKFAKLERVWIVLVATIIGQNDRQCSKQIFVK